MRIDDGFGLWIYGVDRGLDRRGCESSGALIVALT